MLARRRPYTTSDRLTRYSYGTSSNVTPQMARRLQMPSGQAGALVTEVDPDGPSAGALRQGDVILSVNGQQISSASEAGRELQKVAAGRIARPCARRRMQAPDQR